MSSRARPYLSRKEFSYEAAPALGSRGAFTTMAASSIAINMDEPKNPITRLEWQTTGITLNKKLMAMQDGPLAQAIDLQAVKKYGVPAKFKQRLSAAMAATWINSKLTPRSFIQAKNVFNQSHVDAILAKIDSIGTEEDVRVVVGGNL
ncbi:hypothetical protein H4Q26_009318 [Puccinia striiformis f. sp. tritici PST-130]|nr:hypothetical protein H4Q26_009318 [Puccinia striiformis f. sp. tritici PST-130]